MPGPVDTWERTYVVDDGTSCRMPSLRPGPREQRSPGLWKRAEAIFHAYERALILMPAAIATKTGYALGELLKGLLPGLQQVLVVLAATTALGATVGGVIGFFFGGVGAAPGAVVGGELGFEIGSQTVPEIAVSIVAELIACRNLTTPRPARNESSCCGSRE